MVKVQLFAGLAEAIGHRALELPLDERVTVQELKQYLARQYPNLKDRLEKCMVAVNQEYADSDAYVSSQDEVVLIPPVSGG